MIHQTEDTGPVLRTWPKSDHTGTPNKDDDDGDADGDDEDTDDDATSHPLAEQGAKGNMKGGGRGVIHPTRSRHTNKPRAAPRTPRGPRPPRGPEQ